MRDFIGKVFGFYKEINDLKAANGVLKQDIRVCGEQARVYEDRIARLQKEATKLLGEVDMLGKQVVAPGKNEEFWNNKYPLADISYQRYMMLKKGKETSVRIDVRLFIQPNDFVIRNELEKNNLMVEDKAVLNKVVPKIYHLAKKNYKYSYDEESFGFGEVWLFPFELRELRKIGKAGDCEDWSHKIVSYLIAAGVPDWRVRVVCGDTKGGFGGHSTVYVLDDDLKTWRHLNSTTPYHKFDDLALFPDTKDESDKFGIENVWFSFNGLHSWHKFETAGSKKSFNKEKGISSIKILKKNQKSQENNP